MAYLPPALSMDSFASSARITQRDVAKKLGLTQATVSLALRNDSRIPPDRCVQIQEAAEAMGYRPSAAGSALAHMRHTSKIKPRNAALAWLNFWREADRLRSLSEFNQYFEGAAEAANKFGFHLEEFRCADDMSLPRLQSILLTRGIEGILLPPHRRPIDVGGFDWSHFSVVRFGRSFQHPAVHTVSADQVHNTMLAVEQIAALGYERIGFVGNDLPHWLFDAGYLKAQLALPEKRRLPVLNLAREREWEELSPLKTWLAKHRPDAIFTTVVDLHEMLRRLGVRVPEDIALAASTIADCHINAGINQNARQIGRTAVLTLISHLHDNDRGIPPSYRETSVKGSWVHGSFMPPKGPKSRSGKRSREASRKQPAAPSQG